MIVVVVIIAHIRMSMIVLNKVIVIIVCKIIVVGQVFIVIVQIRNNIRQVLWLMLLLYSCRSIWIGYGIVVSIIISIIIIIGV